MSKSKNLRRPGKAASRALAAAKSQLGATVANKLLELASAHAETNRFNLNKGDAAVYAENVLAVAGVPADRIPVLCNALRRGVAGGIDWRKELDVPKTVGAKAIIAGLPAEPTRI